MSKIAHVDPRSLNELISRVHYLKSFIQFTDEDGTAIQAAGPLLSQLLPIILDAVYTHLLSFDITAKAFLPKQPEQDEAGAGAQSVEELSLNHPNIKHRKNFLGQYLVKLVSNKDWSDASPFWRYLDLVGVMHTGEPGFKHRAKRPELRVEFIHMGLLLGWVEDLIAKTVLEEESLDLQTKTKVVRAFNKLLWIQNDLFARHYVVDPATGSLPKGSEAKKLLLATSANSTYANAGSLVLAVGAAVLFLHSHHSK
ncbi:hypothetical protein NEOLEDRAFT_1122379 [Neolentinus lepideus HHB14362 ss-1]|uniref:Globin-sensor domain-containing protein n=1 Tax=Neolentinus lepideus HHB14362 ss-1 TaxID=1314782 RepID=A0A165P7P2_9AGAM|nr:hypothetical protein NEOLEDRAFT_1122379 [Neolentinus lepideus HHB14362 ss-1]